MGTHYAEFRASSLSYETRNAENTSNVIDDSDSSYGFFTAHASYTNSGRNKIYLRNWKLINTYDSNMKSENLSSLPSAGTITKMRVELRTGTDKYISCNFYSVRNISGTELVVKDTQLLGSASDIKTVYYPSSNGGSNTASVFGKVWTISGIVNSQEPVLEFDFLNSSIMLTNGFRIAYCKLFITYTLQDYTIKFVNYDGTTLQQKTVEEGTVPSYSGSTPTRPSTDQYTYKFAGWDKTVVAATGNTTYTAVYTTTINKYTVSTAASPSNGGSVPASRTVNYGTSLSLMASPNTGYEFLKWSDEELSNPRTVTVTSNVTYTAIFTKKTFNITLTSNDGGVVSPSSTTVEYGESFTFNITPSSGYVVSDVLLNSQSIGAVTTYTIDNVTNNYSIEVIFKKIIRMGSVEVSKVYVGAFEITKMYLGSNKIFG